jgi:hypothetical protein
MDDAIYMNDTGRGQSISEYMQMMLKSRGMCGYHNLISSFVYKSMW